MLVNALCLAARVLGTLSIPALLPVAMLADSLSQPIARIRIADVFDKEDTSPKWQDGSLLTWRPTTHYSDNRSNLRMVNRDGKTISTFRIWFPEAIQVNIGDAASNADGSVSAVGTALSKSGAIVSYLVTAGTRTPAVKVIALTPFEGESVVYAPDKSIWVLGYETGEDRKLLKSGPHALLHHYSKEGVLIGKHLRWPEIACGAHPFIGGAGMLTANAGGIGIYLPACRSWLDLTLSGEVERRMQVALPVTYDAKTAKLWNIYLAQDGRVYAFFNHPHYRAPNGRTVHNGLFLLRRDQGLWEALEDNSALAAGDLNWFAGIEGEKLVFRAGANDLVWPSSIPRQ